MTSLGRRRAVLVAGLALLALGFVVLKVYRGRVPAPHTERPRWNVVIVLTDDQRFDTLWAMPRVERLLVEPGTLFANSFASDPICCPFRAGLISGGFYSHHTNVLTAAPPNGSAIRFDDRDTLPVRLARQGYRTGLVGKYMNGLRRLQPRIPPGWSRFVGTTRSQDWSHPEFLVGESGADAPGRGELVTPDSYITYFEQGEALAFLDRFAGEPFFLLLATDAPHLPAQPAGRDAEQFADFSYRGRASAETDLADKPAYVRALAGGSGDAEGGDEAGERLGTDFPARQLRSLRAVDRAVEAVIAKLAQKGVLDRTIVFFTSDNGMLWGEHGLARKGLPYEESIRVPLVVRFPGGTRQKRSELVAADLDIPATVAQLTGLPPRGDGRSLLGLLRGGDPDWRRDLLLEGFGFDADGVPAWAALRGERWKYVEYADGEREVYDLAHDPYELESLSPSAEPAEVAAWSERLAKLHGLAIVTQDIPPAVAGQPYRVQLATWGGTPPLAWTVKRGALPPGITLSRDGVLFGVPAVAGSGKVTVAVEDSTRSPYNGAPKSFLRHYPWTVASAPSSPGE
jgi:N-acetylglucosamine-6-sulfatase